ncbi:hypothetical protein OROHE_005335 [Orobanche hederae]
MEQLLDALKQPPERTVIPSFAIPDMVREWKGMGESMLKSLVGYVSEIESREQKLSAVRESLQKRLKDLEEREREFELFQEVKKRELALRERLLSPICEDLKDEVTSREKKLDQQLKLVEEHIASLELAQSEVNGLRLLECEKLKEIEKREKEVDSMSWSLDKKLREIEQKEKEFNLFRDEKLGELALKEEVLSRKREDFAKEVRLEHEKLRERAELGHGVVERLDSSLNMLEGMKVMIDEKFKEIKSWETAAHKSLIAILSEADLIRESLEKRSAECEVMEREFIFLEDDKMQKLEAKERQLGIMRAKLFKEIKLRDENLSEKFKEIKSWEKLALKNLTASSSEANSIRESLEKRFCEFEEMKKEYNSIQEDKMQKLESKRTQLLEVVKLRDEKITEIQKLGHQTLASLEELLSKKLKEIESREVSLNVACEALGARAKDAEIRLQELEEREKEFQSYQEREMRELVLADEKMRLFVKEFIQELMLREEKFDMQDKMMHGLLKRLELALDNVKVMNTLVHQRFKEISFKEIEHNYTRNWVERKMDELEVKAKAMKEQEDIAMSEEKEVKGMRKEVDTKERRLESCGNDHECNEPHLNDFVKNLELNMLDQPGECLIEQPECKFKQPDHSQPSLWNDGKTLEMLINDTEKDLELIGAEVFKVPFRSSDPAKLVLDAIVFYVPHLGKGDIEVNMWRKSILLLDQLTKMSPSIQPCVREAATALASEWKSRMSRAENSMEVVGFLHFVAAYNLSSCFDKDELLSLLKMVAQHKQTPDLCRILGLSENIPGFVQNLINEKQYLLASTYIHECGLENMFPQAGVLNYYVQHSKAKRRREHTSPEDENIASEIDDLHLAIEHIIKYGLESEYSPDILTARIKQLERDRTSWRNRTPLSANARKWGKRNKRKFQEKQHEAAEEDEARNPEPDTKKGSSLHNAGFYEHLLRHDQETKSPRVKNLRNEVPTVDSNITRKRRRLTRGWTGLTTCTAPP